MRPKVSFIWFDLGYTLLFKQREAAYLKALQGFGLDVPLETLEQEFHLVDKLFMKEYPGVFGKDPDTFMPWFLGLLNYRLGIRLKLCPLYARFREEQNSYQHTWLPYPHLPQVLGALKQRGLRLGIISNWDLSARKLLDDYALSGYFECLIISAEVGYEKPDPRIFRLALRRAGVSAAQSLYVGDNFYDDALGARKVGMDCLIVNRFGALGVEEITGYPIIRDISQVADYLDGKLVPETGESLA